MVAQQSRHRYNCNVHHLILSSILCCVICTHSHMFSCNYLVQYSTKTTAVITFLKLLRLCLTLKMLFCANNRTTPADNWQEEKNMESVYWLGKKAAHWAMWIETLFRDCRSNPPAICVLLLLYSFIISSFSFMKLFTADGAWGPQHCSVYGFRLWITGGP